jgi:hemerythrin-like domain-containing protein
MADSPRTAPDFSRPIEALKACHERLRSQCAALRELMDRVRELGCDAQAQQLAAGVMRYFDTAARHHHADEEEDLLPRMVAAASMGRGLRITRLVADLIREHRELHWAWSRLRTVLQEIAAGERAALDPRAVNRFAAYQIRGGQRLSAGRDAAVERGLRRNRRQHGATTRRRALLTAGFPPAVYFFQMKQPAPLPARAASRDNPGLVT